MIVLGINAYHGDASAALFRDGQLLAAVEEERFTRAPAYRSQVRSRSGSICELSGFRT